MAGYELKFTGSTSNYVGHSADGKSNLKLTDGQVCGSLSWLRRPAIDASIVNPTAVSHSGAAVPVHVVNPFSTRTQGPGCRGDSDENQEVQTPMRAAWYGLRTECLHSEWMPVDGRAWNPHWIRVAEEDEAMKIGPWVARKRKACILGGEIRGGGCTL